MRNCELINEPKILAALCLIILTVSYIFAVPSFLILALIIPTSKKGSELRTRLEIHFMKYHPEIYKKRSLKIGMGERHFSYDFYSDDHTFRPAIIQSMIKEIKQFHRQTFLLIALFIISSVIIALLKF